MTPKKNKKIVGIILGVVASVTIVAISVVAIGKIDTPIAIIKGSTTTDAVSQNETVNDPEDVVVEEEFFEEEEVIIEEEFFNEEEFIIEDLDVEDDFNYESLVLPEVTTKPSTTKPSTTRPSASTPTTTTKAPSNKETTTKKQTGMFGYEFDQLDPNTSHFFTSKDAWQRNFGFCKMYDDVAPLIAFYYDTERVFFTYGEYDWMVQLWKGQYGFVFIGSEIGVYHKEKGNEIEFYDCATDENCLKMKMALYRDEDILLFDRPEGYYWWSTGFVPGKLDKFADRSELKVVAKITLFDTEMRDAFLEAFEKAGFVKESEWVEPEKQPNKAYSRKKFYTVSGNTVSFTWQ